MEGILKKTVYFHQYFARMPETLRHAEPKTGVTW
jgi:hypothetical protein